MLSITTSTTSNEIDQTCVSVVIAAKPDRMRDSLRWLLKIKPWLKVVGEANQSDEVVDMVNQYHPDLVILDTNLPSEESWITILETAKTNCSQTRYLILTDTTQNAHLAELARADAVLHKGFTLTRLFSVIETMFFTNTQPLSVR